MNDNIVEIQNVTKIYYKAKIEIKPLENINLQIKKNDFLALVGPSGSGKTTLLNLIGGLDNPTEGKIIVDNIDIGELDDNDLARWRTHKIGFIFQQYNLLPVLTAYENVELPLLLLDMNKESRKKRVLTALEIVGLKDRLNHYPRQLSGGQEQRTSIARAIVTDPELIIADEPTGNLDANSARGILELLKVLNEDMKKTIIMVTHDNHAAEKANKVIHLEKGQLNDNLRGEQL